MTRTSLHEYLSGNAAEAPNRLAVVDGEESITYGELDRRADAAARSLIDMGVKKGDRVGLYLEKSIDAVVAIYGVLKAGGAYVPLDPSSPVSRLAYIVQDCELRVLVTNAQKAGDVPEVVAQAARTPDVLSMDDRRDAEPSLVPPNVDVAGDDLAYILYTSGSTGVPKGVMLTHRNGLGFVEWAADRFAVGPEDRVSSHAPFHFDLSIFDLFAAAVGGATVVLVPHQTSLFPAALKSFIDEAGITVWYSVPSVLTFLTLRGGLSEGDLPKLRTVLFAGEVFPTRHLRSVMELLPRARFFNLYGPTETNVCTYHEVPGPPSDDGDIPIGVPIDDVEILILDEHGAPVADGEVGELWVRGPTVMRGYWGDDEKTSGVLRPSPSGDLMYGTGDLARRGADGNILFLGRKDSQIKSRGYRIELGDVESAINAHPMVVECAAFAVPDDLATNVIHAHVVAKGEVSADELRQHCLQRVPSYMVPETFAFKEALPKTSTGKTDRQRLAPDRR